MDKKEQIYKSALKLFNQKGFDKTPTSLISKEAGVATGTLFHYFKTKEDLINSLYLRCKEYMLIRVFQGVKEEKTYKSKLKKIYRNFLQWGMANKEAFLFFQQFSNSPYIRDLTRQEGKSKLDNLVTFLKEGIEQDILRGNDPEYLQLVISNLFSANLYYLLTNPHLAASEEFLEDSFALLWDGIKN